MKSEKKKQNEKAGCHVSERSCGSVYRSIPLPPGVDAEKADPFFKNGVWTARLPQAAEAKEKVKRVKARSA